MTRVRVEMGEKGVQGVPKHRAQRKAVAGATDTGNHALPATTPLLLAARKQVTCRVELLAPPVAAAQRTAT